MTPSPVTMSYTTKDKVEDKMNVIAKTFASSEIKYSHSAEDKYWGETKELWHGNYREEGLYYVDITSDAQPVTKCTNAHGNCSYPGEHPKNKVDDSFILNIIRTPNEETKSYWGNIANEFYDGEYLQNIAYSKKSVQLEPESYELPDYILEALVKQKYGKVVMSFADTYRWSLYSDTLDNSYKWSEMYNLETHIVSNDAVTSLVGGTAKGMQFKFEQKGRLFGTVAFDINLDTILPVYNKLTDKNLGLYAYDEDSGSLKLVSDVIVTDDNWASANLKEILPTTYVLKAKNTGDIVKDLEEDFSSYYLTSKTSGQYGEWNEPRDKNPILIDEKKDLTEIEKIITGEESAKLYYAGKTTTRTVVISVCVVVVILAGIACLYFYKIRRESK